MSRTIRTRKKKNTGEKESSDEVKAGESKCTGNLSLLLFLRGGEEKKTENYSFSTHTLQQSFYVIPKICIIWDEGIYRLGP